jgi:SAM-dependent methyltransferase
VDDGLRESAQHVRSLIESGRCPPSIFRAALSGVAAQARDAWVDVVFGLGPPPEDGPELPRGCVPYLPSPIDALLRVADHAPVQATDRFVDIGSGVGRAAAVMHLLTGAPALGLEVQPALVAAARALAARLQLPGVSFFEGDAAQAQAPLAGGSVFLLYCPFSGERLGKVLDRLQVLAHATEIRVCCLDLPLPPTPWLEPASPRWGDLTIYRSSRSTLNRS